jgi:hypothetical protein
MGETIWEYRVELLGTALRGARPADLEQLLNNGAEQGWEPVDLMSQSNSSKVWVVLRRRSGAAPRPRRRAGWP